MLTRPATDDFFRSRIDKMIDLDLFGEIPHRRAQTHRARHRLLEGGSSNG